MLLPFLHNFAHQKRFYVSYHMQRPTDVYGRFRLMRRTEEAYLEFGQIRLQAIPDDRVQVYFSSEPLLGPKEVDLENKEFSQFCQDLFAELIRLGFVIPPPEEKPPIGFLKEYEP